MFEKVIWGNSLEEWGIFLIILVSTFIITKLVSVFSKKVLKPFTTKTKNRFDDVIYFALESPILFGIMLLGIWIAIHQLVTPEKFVKAIDDAYRILIVLNVTWVFTRLTSGLLDNYWGERSDGHAQKMMPVVKRAVLTVVWVIGIVTALSNVGINISALLGTLGIGGIAFALAAQDTVKNIFGAFTIFTDKPFSIGDTIRVDSFEGTIIDVGVRSTKLMDYDKRIVTLPNFKITDASIINISSEPMRRVVMKLGLTYDTTPEKMQEALDILRGIPKKVDFVSKKSDNIIANFSGYGDSALEISFIYFIEKKGNIRKVTSDMNMEILKSFNAAGLNFAFPSQTLYLQKEQ
ncbi:MscS family membrane protein [Parabacteroides sp. PFB2-12]|uniref:mechanosensitive ion channel family protein n=1 Tax=unclassified Parabacteroides TaxID=2649774 RepID=UPI0024751566|nr:MULTISPECIES: mechanosensitive ion channel family protein [unclassified Parabacteroides]MDH6343398.1 MscS family membrane protein [Parabacteroides sp. PM6-13]MDH6392010.1 MscS family membrane protein [Parabacteroides sp. PFB2-12]